MLPELNASTMMGSKASKGMVTSRAGMTRYMAVNPVKWDYNDFEPKLLNPDVPLLDRTHTPRGAARAISLDRNKSNLIWMPGN